MSDPYDWEKADKEILKKLTETPDVEWPGMPPPHEGLSAKDAIKMLGERPLHVKVAEALGYKRCGAGSWHPPDFEGHPDPVWPTRVMLCFQEDTRFDIDWAATGPLIEKYKIMLVPWGERASSVRWWTAAYEAQLCGEFHQIEGGTTSSGPTILIAVCNLILALHAAGKLKEMKP